MASITHPVIGPVKGKGGDGCTQFLGVKYATLKDRFADAEVVHYDGSGIDATSFGPQAVSPEQAIDFEFGFIQQSLPKPNSPGISDTECLHLNITVPTGTKSESQLPVLVFIHGGGFAIGGNWWPQYDFGRLVKLSVEAGKPFIGININYRVGALGFLTSPELRAAGYKPNSGLRDQRTALRWIKDNIGGFGGDPDNVTVMGQSAGSVSTGLLLLSEEKLAKRLICLGASPPLMGSVLPREVADQAAQSAVNMLGLKDVPSSEVVSRLLGLPVHDFIAKITPAVPLGPTIDGHLVPRQFSFESFAKEVAQMPGSKWTESILVGVCKLDASIVGFLSLLARKAGIGAAFRASASKSLNDHPQALASLLDLYGLSDNSSDDDADLIKVLSLISDIMFFLPAVGFAKQFPSESFLLAIDEPNPWDGPFKGHAAHILDIAFLLQNFNETLDQGQKTSAVAFGMDVIAFVSGDKPWNAFNRGEQGGIMVYAQGKRQAQKTLDDQRQALLQFLESDNGLGLDGLSRVATDFMKG